MSLEILAQEKVWLDKSKYADAERVYYERLSKPRMNNNVASAVHKKKNANGARRQQLDKVHKPPTPPKCRSTLKVTDCGLQGKMSLEILAQEKVWLDKSKYADAERVYYERLSKNPMLQPRMNKNVASAVHKNANGARRQQLDKVHKPPTPPSSNLNNNAVVQSQDKKDIEVVAIDCEMVGIHPDGRRSMLARVSIVNSKGKTIYDKFVKPTATVTDYRTPVSGIRPENIEHGELFVKVKKEVTQILKNKLLVGHGLEHDLRVLTISHPKHMIRDTSTYRQFKQLTGSQRPGLKQLALRFLGASIQEGEHSSVQDAKAALQLYILARKDWERLLKKRRNRNKPQNKSQGKHK